MRKLFLSGLWYFCFFAALAQSRITGVIVDSIARPLSGTAVLIRKPQSSIIQYYTFSDQRGYYTIDFKIPSDSVVITVKMMGFSTVKKTVNNNSQTLNFSLDPKTEMFKKLVIKMPKPITLHGDTLAYNVSQFSQIQDRSIGDVIAHMPGIEIKDDGEILYRGKPINRYYVNGMDMLDGRYGLINNNLPEDKVVKVQILEHHQPIKVLDSLVFSDRAALNIKLKKKRVMTGKGKAGIGASPFLWEADLTPMLFSAHTQFLGSYQTNNTGNPIKEQLTDHTGGSSILLGGDSGKDWLNIQKLAPPNFSTQRWLNNNSHLGTLNLLDKLGNDYKIKAHISYMNLYFQQHGQERTRFFTPTDTVSLQEIQYNQTFNENFQAGLTLEKNTSAYYLKDNLIFDGAWEKGKGHLMNGEGDLQQSLSNNSYSLGNNLKIITPIGGQLLNIHSNIALSKTPQNLKIFPGQFPDLLNGGEAYHRTFQDLAVKTFYAAHSLGFIKKVGKFSFSPKIGFNYTGQKLNSRLFTGENKFLGDAFHNGLQWNNTDLYFNLNTSVNLSNWQITLRIPLKLKSYTLIDKAFDKGQKLNKFLFDPHLSITKFLGDYWELNASAGRDHSFGTVRQLHYGFILENYRHVRRINSPIPISSNRQFGFHAAYRNSLEGVFGNIGFSYSRNKHNLVYNTHISPNGAMEITATQRNHLGQTRSVSGEVTKLLWGIRTKLTFKAGYSNTDTRMNLNGTLSYIRRTNSIFALTFDTDFTDWFNMKYVPAIYLSNNTIEGKKQNQVRRQVQQVSINLHPFEQHSLGLVFQYYNNNISGYKDQLFADIRYRFSWKKKNLDFELLLTNIFNTKRFHTISIDQFSRSETNYLLRPRQIVFRVGFSL